MEFISRKNFSRSFDNLVDAKYLECSESRSKREEILDDVNKLYLHERAFEKDWPRLRHLLELYKKQFMFNDLDNSNTLDIWELGRLMERLGEPKTHLQLKDMMAKVDREHTGKITYNDFLFLMLGKSNSVLHLTLKFEELNKDHKIPVPRPFTPRRHKVIWKLDQARRRSLFGWKQDEEGKWIPSWPELQYPQ